MHIEFDREANALYIEFTNAKVWKSQEIAEGIIVDFDKRKNIVGIEILDVSSKFPKQELKK